MSEALAESAEATPHGRFSALGKGFTTRLGMAMTSDWGRGLLLFAMAVLVLTAAEKCDDVDFRP